ncbi:MAG: 1-acyl-sn-glycerol-3-phosphate acyltransferase [Chloroflexi bacterium]|nr:1-acyl-sn-glycerol-3-phosphate acyltransferase [Chloroflexota bacterium]MCC6895676.1 1-acyl-sn-glycerol-3-phosphate acyltransferase [Anaerolineae bacterium]
MSVSADVQAYVDRQPRLRWRRVLLRGLIRSLGFKVIWDVNVTGLENIPDSGPCIIMMNHISMIDPVLCMGAVTNRFVIPMTKIENMRNPIIGPFVRWWGSYTINRSEVDRKALTNSIELIKNGQLILIAPEGHRHPEGLAEAKDGLAFVATKADAVIIPTAISGAIGWNKKLFRFQRPKINVNFGRPFKFRTGGTRVSREVLATMSHEAMYQLAMAVTDETKRGFYSDLSKATTEYIEFVNV